MLVVPCSLGGDVARESLLVSAPSTVTAVQLRTGAGTGDPLPFASSGVVPGAGVGSAVVLTGPGSTTRTVAAERGTGLDVPSG